MAAESGVPVIAFDAVHEGTTHKAAMDIDDDKFAALAKRLELAVGAPVLLMHNAAVEHGLMNGSQGSVVDIVYCLGCHPNHSDVARCMPESIVVAFPGYSGPPFFADSSRQTWVPILPRTVSCDQDSSVTRTQFPLCLAWALTPWKAQGMTLAKVIVKLASACSKPGVLFVALTRVRHPDHLLLEDDFPAFSVIRKQLLHPSFSARQSWERRMRVLFSRTLRKHMQDSPFFPPDLCWSTSTNRVADLLVDTWRTNRDITLKQLWRMFASKTKSCTKPTSVQFGTVCSHTPFASR